MPRRASLLEVLVDELTRAPATAAEVGHQVGAASGAAPTAIAAARLLAPVAITRSVQLARRQLGPRGLSRGL